MIDGQAERLRARVAAAAPRPAPLPDPDARTHVARPAKGLARAVAVASGKGGVGKSTVALGIAMAAAERGVRTAIVDADLGMANIDVLAGVRPKRNALDWLDGRAMLSDCFVTLAPRLWLLPGASGVAAMADLPPARRRRFLEGLARVSSHVELLVIDLGAGIAPGTVDVAVAADRLLVVSTPEPTALTDAYGFVKACVRAGRTGGVSCVANMARDAADGGKACDRLSQVARAHLGIVIEPLGSIRIDAGVPSSVRARVPLLASDPRGPAARDLRSAEARLAGLEQRGLADRSRFLQSLALRLAGGMAWSASAAAVGVAALGGTLAG